MRSRPERALPKFQALQDADIPELEEMILALYREAPTGQKMSLRKARRTIAELSAHPEKGTITLFRVGRTIAGYAIVIPFWSNEYGGTIAHIDELFVREPWRSMGIGSSFLNHVARSMGASLRGLHLEIAPGNRKAEAFYVRHGFTPATNRHMVKARRAT